MSSLQSLAKETVIYGLSHILPRILHYLVMGIYLTHRFDGENIEYGIYTELYAYAAVLLAVMLFRLDTAYFRFGSKETDKEKVFGNLLLLMLGTAGILGLLIYIGSEFIAAQLHYPGQGYYVEWFAVILGLDAFSSLVYARFRLSNRPLRFMFFRVGNVLITVLAVLFFLELNPRLFEGLNDRVMNTLGLQNEVDFVFLSNLIASIVIAMLMIPEFLKARMNWDKTFISKVVKYSWPLMLVALAASFNQNLGVMLQKSWLPGSIEVNQAMIGVYGGAAKLAVLLSLFTVAFNYAAEPFFFNHSANDDDRSVYGQVALAYTITAAIVILATYCFIDIILLMIGESYRAGEEVIPVLLFAYLFLGLYYMVAIWYKLSDHTRIGAVVALVGVVVTALLNIILLPSIGILATAVATLCCYVTMVILCYLWGQKLYPIAYPIKDIIGIVFFTMLVVAASSIINFDETSLNLIVQALLFLLAVGLLLFYYKSFIRSTFLRKS